MTYRQFFQLFRDILSPRREVVAAKIESMGLLAIKIAQMYAVRPDLIGGEKCRVLSRLLHQTTPLSPETWQKRWEELVPQGFLSVVDKVEKEPLSSASLGQVHRATLRDGREVVVKMARAEAREPFLADVAKARRLVQVMLCLYPKLKRLADPLGVIDAVERTTLREMDFFMEPKGAALLTTLAGESAARLPHLARLHFPRYYPEFSAPGFLVSEFIEGPTVATLLDQGNMPYAGLLELFRIHGYFLFVRGQFHGDFHPGNIIWREDGVWLLDNANVEKVPPVFSRGLFQVLLHLQSGETRAAARQLEQLSLRPLKEKAKPGYEARFDQLYRDFPGKTVSETSLTSQMMQTVKLAVQSGMTFPSGAFPLIKSLMYLDGMVLQSHPQAILLEDVARFAGDFGR